MTIAEASKLVRLRQQYIAALQEWEADKRRLAQSEKKMIEAGEAIASKLKALSEGVKT